MPVLDLLLLLLIAGICGSIAQALVGVSRGGCIVAIVLGFVGAVLGRWMADALDLPEVAEINGFPVVWSIIGASLFVAVLSLLTGRRRG